MANSEIGTSSSNYISRGEYQVFLSFRGPDTRHGFTSCLHRALEEAGIRVFIDNEELRVGERISGNLLQAIDNSKLYIPIFSKTYASSHWCLRELAKMVENSSKSKEDGKEKVILPIFYHVKLDDVKLKTELYSEAISNLEQIMEGQEKKFSSEEVKTWRQALNEVDGIKGWEVEKYPGEGDLIRLVVHKVVIELQTRQRQVDNDLVGMEDEIALCRQRGAHATVTSEQIKRFPHLQFLWLFNVICQGDFTSCLSELKWINLAAKNQCLEATNLLHLEKAVVVNLEGLDIPEDVFEGLIKGAGKLKVLSVIFNRLIRRIPAFCKDSALEKLTIFQFSSLTKIDRAIGKLRCLTDLTFNICPQLKEMPEEIGNLWNLRHLYFSRCGLIELPNSVSQLTSLETLDLCSTKITRLPDSIGRLSNLSSVDLSSTLIERLPRTISQLLHLQTLRLDFCDRIQELPELLPGSLTTLRLSSESLVTVPNLSDLTNLVELDLSGGFKTTGISNTIQRGDLRWIGSLSKLRKLRLGFSNVCAPTTELGSLSQLEELDLFGLGMPTLDQLPSKLKVLVLYDTQWTQVRLPPSEIVSSSSKELSEDEASRKIQFLESHRTSEMSVPLQEVPGGSELQASELIDHWREAFRFPSSLKLLKKFSLSWCPKVQHIEFVSTWESLSEFSVEGWTSLKSLVGLSNSKNLTRLTLKRCPSLQVVEGIDELGFLRLLRIEKCMSMGMIFDALSSKIPNKCVTLIRSSGELPDNAAYPHFWESYREKIMNGTKLAPDTEVGTTDSLIERGEQALDSEIETKDSETQTRDPLQETNQENEEKKRKRKTQSAKQGGGRKRRKLQKKPLQRLSHLIIFFCRTGNMEMSKKRGRQSAKEQGKKRGRWA